MHMRTYGTKQIHGGGILIIYAILMMPSNKDGHHYGNKEIMNNAYLANFLRGKDQFYMPSVLQ